MRIIAVMLLLIPCLANAEPPQLTFPAKCTPGKDCWIVNYLDDDPAQDAARDFTCGAQTYEGHDGTDIAIRDWKALAAGVDVLASAAGTVLRVRDGVKDQELPREELQKLLKENRACGNGVFIDHGGGWQTIYCHMKQGSIVVKPGDPVQAGQKLGQVGHTGFVEFPHVHLGVMHEKQMLDPFTGLDTKAGCGRMGTALWKKDLAPSYEPVSVYAAGFSDHEPDFDQIKHDATSPPGLLRSAAALTFWAGIFGVAAGDRIEMQILDPQGRVFAERSVAQERTRARQFYFVGKRTRSTALIEGSYTGVVRLTRNTAGGAPITRELSRKLEVK